MKKVLVFMVLVIALLTACAVQQKTEEVQNEVPSAPVPPVSAPAPETVPVVTAPVPEPTPPIAPITPAPAPLAAPVPGVPLIEESIIAPAPTGLPKTVEVAIRQFQFIPAEVTVNMGDTVVWTNEDLASHTVESADGTLKSTELFQGDKFQFTFIRPGIYQYICGIHPSMRGGVTVA